ncbi:MAG: Rho termination factor N-terminal domain-containing protein [Thermoleophilaceae bacterium]
MTVLQRDELEQSPLADLHAIASELGLEGYRRLVRDDLIGAIVGAQGGAEETPATEEKSESESPAPRRQGRRSRSRRGGGSRSRDDEGSKAGDGPKAEEAAPAGAAEESDDDDEAEREPAAGVLDILSNGSGFLRTAAGSESDDVYVSPAQIRRCELRAGDEVAGRSRPGRRNERHPSLVRVEQVNGHDAEPPEQRALFSDLTAVHATERLPVPDSLGSVPIGKGSRVAVAGGPGAGATRLLRAIVESLSAAGGDLQVSVVLVGARPEEVTDWRRESGVPVTGGSFDASDDVQVQAAELAVEQAKRVAERGGDAVVVIDSLESLPGGAARRLFGAARKLEEGGSLTVIAATGMAWEPQRQASARVALDAPAEDGSPQVSASRSGTLRADLLA